MTPGRGKYAGVLQIVRYNAHFYAGSACFLLGLVVLLWLRILPAVGQALVAAAAVLAAFWTLGSLASSYFVYDHAGVTRWNWLPERLTFSPHKWVNIHAGLDESTETLKRLFPHSNYSVLDIYDPQEMTERSIARARKAQHAVVQTATPCKLDSLPLTNEDCDTVFLLFSAHEIRQAGRRVEFFRESARVLSNRGQLILVEHLRDWSNFVAFGPGFLHFYSRDEWLRVAKAAGFTLEREGIVTPLVRCFVMHKNGR